jgi:uncharacterized membrane protein HdeD (DUF308 family)
VSSYAEGRGEALPWWLVLVEGIVVALFGLILLVAPGASLFFLVLLGIYLLVAGIFRIIGIFLDSSSWGWKLIAGVLCLIAGVAILSDPLWSTTLASTWLVILVGFLALLQGAAGLVVAFQGGGWGMGFLSVLGILFGLFLVINPPDRGGDANVHPGDLHAHWGYGSGSSGIQDAEGSGGRAAAPAGALGGQATSENTVKRKSNSQNYPSTRLGE